MVTRLRRAAPARRTRLIACLLAATASSTSLNAFCASSTGGLNLEHYRGKVVLVDFWASWCKPCHRSIPWLNEMRARYADNGLVVLGVNVDARKDDAERFLQEVPAQFDMVYDPAGSLAEQYHVAGMPATFVFDRSGRLAEQHLGFLEADRPDYESTLQRLLSEPIDKP